MLTNISPEQRKEEKVLGKVKEQKLVVQRGKENENENERMRE